MFNDATKDLIDALRYKAKRRKNWNRLCFLGHGDPEMLEIGSQQMQHDLRASLAASMYGKKDERLAELVKFFIPCQKWAIHPHQ